MTLVNLRTPTRRAAAAVPGRFCAPGAAGTAAATGILLVIACITLPLAAAEPFAGANWIWAAPAPGANTTEYPGGAVRFRAALDLPKDVKLAAAEVRLSADNAYTLFVNGQRVGATEGHDDDWRTPGRFDVLKLLAPGRNVVAVEAVNSRQGPAGLIVVLTARTADGKAIVLATGKSWRCSAEPTAAAAGWEKPGFDDAAWKAAHIVAPYGQGPWGRLRRANAPIVETKFTPPATAPPPAGFSYPAGIVFLSADTSLYARPRKPDPASRTIFRHRQSQAYPEYDLPAPNKTARKLYALVPARPDGRLTLLHDAGKGTIGSPSVSFDGRTIYFAMAAERDSFYHVYAMPAAGGTPRQLTRGPFHDVDPVELPDGRIAFTSTRVGTFEEYHNTPSRAVFTMKADGSDARPLTTTIAFDSQAAVMRDGRLVLLRTDNFFDRTKVETLLHGIHPDGTLGYTEFGLDNAPEYGDRLRKFTCGMPSPMPDGRLAFLSAGGITVGLPGHPLGSARTLRLEAGDLAPTPDDRLLCTLASRAADITDEGEVASVDLRYRTIAVVDPDDGKPVLLFASKEQDVHSPTFLGPRPRPPVVYAKADHARSAVPGATGFLYCQDVRRTRNATAGWEHVRAVRVLAARPTTVRSSHSDIVHAGSEAIELGTVPLAPDGSIYLEVPADVPLALQAVDAEGRSEINETSWIYVRPGEQRGCVGCHHVRHEAPPVTFAHRPMALSSPPLRALGQGQPHRFRGNNAAVNGLMDLQFDRFREVAGLSRHGDAADPLATGPSQVRALLRDLASRDPAIRLSAAQTLAVVRTSAAAEALANRLDDDADRHVRVAAALALAACGTRASVPPLLDALDDDDALVRQAAAVALENLTAHREPFDAFAPSAQRLAQLRALRAHFTRVSWDQREADLVRQLEGPDRSRHRPAIVALSHVGSAACLPALRAYVQRESDPAPYLAWAKKHPGRTDLFTFNGRPPLNPRTLQAAVRALGRLRDAASIPTLAAHLNAAREPVSTNLFLAEAAADALGMIAAPEAEAALLDALLTLPDYHRFPGWYGDHDALWACHASPVHYRIIEALDAIGSARGREVLAQLIRALPTDPDRALFPFIDDHEALVGRLVRRAGAEAAVVETCLALLGDVKAARDAEVERALRTVHGAWAGRPDPENRAAQVLSIVCRDRSYAPRVAAALARYRARPPEPIVRVFINPVTTPVRPWVCFYLARALGYVGEGSDDARAALLACLEKDPPESSRGRPDPAGPGVHFLHNDYTPCHRAAAAWALGRLGDASAVPVLLRLVENLDNAPDTRHACAEALARLASPAHANAIRKLASTYPELSTRKALLTALARVENRDR